MHKLELTSDDVQLIQSALTVVSPAGGGSAVFTLYQKIVSQAAILCDDVQCSRMVATVLRELANQCENA